MARQLTPAQMTKALRLMGDDKAARKELRKTYRSVAVVSVKLSRAEMRRGSRQLAAVAGKIRGTSNTQAARISVPLGRPAAAIYGTNRPTGWLGNARHAGTVARNNPPPIGNTWKAATRGQGPYGINDALADGEPKIVAEFERAATDLIDRTFGL